MKITAQDLLRLGIIDGIIPEPIGGAHRDGVEVVKAAGDTIVQALAYYDDLNPAEIRKERREKFLSMGRVELGRTPKKAPFLESNCKPTRLILSAKSGGAEGPALQAALTSL